MSTHVATIMQKANMPLKDLLALLFANYDSPFGEGSESAKARAQAYAWSVEGKPIDLVERVVKDFLTGNVDRPASRRAKLPTSEEFSAQLRARAAEKGGLPAVAMAPAFGALWGARLYDLLMKGPDGDMPAPSVFIASKIAVGGEIGERYRLQHQAANGFRKVSAMLQDAEAGKGCIAEDALLPVASTFEPVPAYEDVFEQWKALHAERGWPWLAYIGKQRVVYFPREVLLA